MNQDKLIKKLEDSISHAESELNKYYIQQGLFAYDELYDCAYSHCILEVWHMALNMVVERGHTVELCISSMISALAQNSKVEIENPFHTALIATKAKALASVARQLHDWAYFDGVGTDLAK